MKGRGHWLVSQPSYPVRCDASLSIQNYIKEMESVKLGPNVVAYGAAMAALANGKQWELALKLLDEVGNHGANGIDFAPLPPPITHFSCSRM